MLLKPHAFLALSLASALLFTQCAQNNTTDKAATTTPENTTVTPAVKPPLENINVPLNKQLVQPAEGAVLRYATGTTIDIPANIFVDKQGNPVNTPVEISFREFHSAADIIASGIPMSVRMPDGHTEWMQTAGMFEILGSSQGQPVEIAPGKSVSVNLASRVDGQYGFWVYDQATQNWVQTGSTVATSATEGITPLSDIARLRQSIGEAPLPPIAYDQQKIALNFDVDVNRFPELRQLKNIIWQYAGTDPKLDPANNKWIFSKSWEDAKIEPGKGPNDYMLTLIHDDGDYTIPVCPTRKGMELKEAQIAYERLQREYDRNKKALEQKLEILEAQLDFQRNLRAEGFGLYNCDLLWSRNDVVAFQASFDFGNEVPESAKQWIQAFLVTADGRSVINMTCTSGTQFRYSPSWDNKLVAILPGNKVAVFTQEDFKQQEKDLLGSNAARYTFKMRLLDQPVQSVADVAKALNKAG